MTRTLGERALALAIRDIGTKEVPPGSNTGTRVREMQGNTWLPGTGWPWCAAAVCTWYEEAGYRLPDPSAGAKDLTQRAARNGWGRSVPIRAASPGAIVSWNIGSGHVSLLERYDERTGLVHTVDGNSGDMVKRCARPASLVFMAVIVAGDGTVTRPKPKGPWRQIVTSESGHEVVVYGSRNLDRLLRRAGNLLRSGTKAITIRRGTRTSA